MTKSFKQMYSDVENWNNIKYWDNSWEVDYHQLDPNNMDTFLNLEDTFIESKKKYGEKMGSSVIVGRKEKHLEVNWLNYMIAHIEPNRANDYVHYVGMSTDSNWNKTPRFVKFYEENNYRKVTILQDGMYYLEHKEELALQSADREVFSFINRSRAWEVDQQICVYHIQWNVNKTLTWTTSGTDPNGSCRVTMTLTLWEMHPRITWYMGLYTFLKKWDILEYKILWNKTDLNEANRVDISSQVRQFSNYWQVEYVNFTFDDLSDAIKQRLPRLT